MKGKTILIKAAAFRFLLCNLVLWTAGSLTSVWAGENASGHTAPALGNGLINGAQETVSLVGSLFKVFGALVVVIGLMLLLINWARKLGFGKGIGNQGGLIRVLDNRMLAPKKYVSVLEVAGEFMVVGVTEQNINLLATLPQNQELLTSANKESQGAAQISSFAAMLTKAGRSAGKSKSKESSDA